MASTDTVPDTLDSSFEGEATIEVSLKRFSAALKSTLPGSQKQWSHEERCYGASLCDLSPHRRRLSHAAIQRTVSMQKRSQSPSRSPSKLSIATRCLAVPAARNLFQCKERRNTAIPNCSHARMEQLLVLVPLRRQQRVESASPHR